MTRVPLAVTERKPQRPFGGARGGAPALTEVRLCRHSDEWADSTRTPAVPVEGIVVDGDLSDWPEEMRGYPIAVPGDGVRPKDEKDFAGRFRIGYSAGENALYVAMEVRDESTVIDTTEVAWWETPDGCKVLVDGEHNEKDSPMVQRVIYGDQSGIPREDTHVEVRREGSVHRYEWRMDIGRMSREKVHLHSGMVMGFGVVVCDKDRDGSFSKIAWGRRVRITRGREVSKATFAGVIGDVMLVEERERMGKIRGRVRWEGSGNGVARGKVRIRSLEREGWWVQVETDREGEYAVEISEGRYRVEPEIGRGDREGVEVEVREGRATEVELEVKPSGGVAVKAGKGRTVKAGVGSQQGVWLTLDAVDDFVRKPFREGELFEKIEEQLGVEYVYELPETPSVETEKATPLTQESFAELPPELVDGMREATTRLDLRRLNELIDRIVEYDVHLAEGLRNLANRYEYEALSDLFHTGNADE